MQIKIKESMQPDMQAVEDRMRMPFSNKPMYIVSMLEQLISFSKTSIRPPLVLYMGSLFGAGKEALLDLAAAIEMLHIAALVHNDLIDNAVRPRPQQTVNQRFSTSSTVLAGDLAYAAAAQLAASVKSIPVMKNFSETLQLIVNGEITELFKETEKWDKQSYMNLIRARTASVFELAGRMAAAIGSANQQETQSAAQFGYHLGMAYQFMTDVLKFVGKSSDLRMNLVSDLGRGKMTMPTLLYLESVPDAYDFQTLNSQNGNGQARLEDLVNAVYQSDAIDRARQEAERYVHTALEALDQLPATGMRAELAQLAKDVILLN
jgi:geranylgeranyl pyrophosphate synthase